MFAHLLQLGGMRVFAAVQHSKRTTFSEAHSICQLQFHTSRLGIEEEYIGSARITLQIVATIALC